MRRTLLIPSAILFVEAVSIPSGHAAEGTELASAFDEGDSFDLNLGVNYAYEGHRVAIKREFAGLDGSTADGPVPIVKDLLFQQNRHLITPHLELGIFHDLQLSAALPIVVSDAREYVFDQRANPCIYPGDGSSSTPTCIDRTNSSTLLDALLPDGTSGSLGYNAEDPESGFSADSPTVFRGVTRSGLDQVHLGLTWAPLNEARDDTKPTWVIGAELRFSIGKIMRFDRLAPTAQDGVSRGVHELRLHTGLSKRTMWAEPYIFFFWQTPIAVRDDDPENPEGSLFWNVGYGQENLMPQQRAGATFGFEAVPWENPLKKQKFAIEFRGNLQAHFDGRGYSEMWEVFAYAGDAENNSTGPLVVDQDPTTSAVETLSHPGITEIENYLTFGANLGVRGQLGANAELAMSFSLDYDQAHRISWTDAGAETDDADDVVTPGTNEVNPLHKQLIDLSGRRYIADEATTFTFLVTGRFLF